MIHSAWPSIRIAAGTARDMRHLRQHNNTIVSIRPAVYLAIYAAALSGAAFAQEVLKKEPPSGAIKQGQIVLIDDGTCPAGQIKEVRGGKGEGPGSVKRTRRCVARQ